MFVVFIVCTYLYSHFVSFFFFFFSFCCSLLDTEKKAKRNLLPPVDHLTKRRAITKKKCLDLCCLFLLFIFLFFFCSFQYTHTHTLTKYVRRLSRNIYSLFSSLLQNQSSNAHRYSFPVQRERGKENYFFLLLFLPLK